MNNLEERIKVLSDKGYVITVENIVDALGNNHTQYYACLGQQKHLITGGCKSVEDAVGAIEWNLKEWERNRENTLAGICIIILLIVVGFVIYAINDYYSVKYYFFGNEIPKELYDKIKNNE